ncbi:hypothetical protein ACH5RR_013289 [Cinchona calisaya]|uniref:Uncharacterized protein n=1 Tax=Cinchona calisaya TaxID=153742 RepID=A0ABD3A2A2_9GENT
MIEMSKRMLLSITKRYKYLCSKFVKLVALAFEVEEAYEMLEKDAHDLALKVEEIRSRCMNMGESNVDIQASPVEATEKSESAKENSPIEVLAKRVRGLKKKERS